LTYKPPTAALRAAAGPRWSGLCFYWFGLLVAITHEAGARFLVTRILCELRHVFTASCDMDTPRLKAPSVFSKCWRSARAQERDAIAASPRPSSRGKQPRRRAGSRPQHLTLPTRRGFPCCYAAVTLLHTSSINHARGGSPCVHLEPDAGAAVTRAAARPGTLDTQSSDTPYSQTDLAARSKGNPRSWSTIHTRHTRKWEICALFSTFPNTTILTQKLSTLLPVRYTPQERENIICHMKGLLPYS
jgi:hypothetical protein